ncbi:TPA: hypothetical protein L3F68_003900 [Enterobacter hormaechei]|nr:hypothetical protein [Enterobacter hormaechei]
MAKIKLTLEQIKSLAKFAEEEGQPEYTICHGQIPGFDNFPDYDGLIVYSGSEEHSVLALEDKGQGDI